MSETAADQPFLPSWARYVIIPGLLGPVGVLGFIFVNELAHDEGRCPYTHGETRALSPSVVVREDQRNCLWNVEDHRFSVIRDGHEKTLGRRRFKAAEFAAGKYSWEAKLSEHDEVQLSVHNAGHDDAAFREGTPADEGK
jgi:hypothetical protein